MNKGTHIKQYKEHGLGMYRYRKCRCEICKSAAAADRVKYRKYANRLYLPAAPLIERLVWAGQLDQVPGDVVKSWRMKGVYVYSADYWCLKFGFHPAEIYGYHFYKGCFDGEDGY